MGTRARTVPRVRKGRFSGTGLGHMPEALSMAGKEGLVFDVKVKSLSHVRLLATPLVLCNL